MSERERIDLSGIDVTSVDNALMTTRAVRLRLDLERDVDDQIIFDCIDVAEQAPSGGNQGSRRWVIVRDPEIKARIADLYMQSAGQWMVEARDRLEAAYADGVDHPNRKVMRSAAYLAEHLAEVPAIVVPTIIGIHDASGRPGLFDSVIQSVWSFCVALRARGLGTSWTTAILQNADELGSLLGIPSGNTPIAMIPVGWTKGTEFSTAPRFPARQIAFIDAYGLTWQRGPSDPVRFEDGPGTVVEVDIRGSVADVWSRVVDINAGAPYSTEFVGARWRDAGIESGLGAVFIGSNSNEYIGEWELECIVDRFVPEREFGWATVDVDEPGARWWFELSPIAGAVRLRHGVVLGPGPSGLTAAIEKRPDAAAEIIRRRVMSLRENMQRVVDGIRGDVESGRA